MIILFIKKIIWDKGLGFSLSEKHKYLLSQQQAIKLNKICQSLELSE